MIDNSAQEATPPPPAMEDDWGDDGEDEHLLVAASQLDQVILTPAPCQGVGTLAKNHTEPEQVYNCILFEGSLKVYVLAISFIKVVVDQEDLLAMTALIGDDDFLDDFEEEGPGVAQERLNQTVTVFPGQEEKMKPPRQPDSHADLVRQEEEKLRKLNLKFQGEATFLRSQLSRKEQEVEGERQMRRKVETDLQEKLEKDRKVWEDQVNVVKTENMFLLQELQQLKERVRKEAKHSPAASSVNSQVIKNSQQPGSRLSFPSNLNSPRPRLTKETQTSLAKPRIGRLRLLTPKVRLASIGICNLGPLRSEDKAGLLMASTFPQLESQVRALVESTIEAGKGRQARESEVGQLLEVLLTALSSSPNQVTADLRTSITEFCSNLLSSMIRVKRTEVLPAVLSLLVESWQTALQDSDVTSYNLSLIGRLIASSTKLPESSVVLEKYFALISRVGSDVDQREVLCKDGQDQDGCFLLCLPILIKREEMARPHLQAAAVQALSK